MVLQFIYKDLFQNNNEKNKIKPKSSILIVTYDKNDSFDYIQKNKPLFRENKHSVTSSHDDNYKIMSFDYIIFNFLFSHISNQENIEKEFATYRKYLKPTGLFIFIEELITKEETINYHPFSYIRNTLHYLPFFNIRKNITMDSFYSTLLNNSISIVDTYRVITLETIPTFSQEFFIITCSNNL